jgi:HAD superfamily hydrolase (TIGR01490 family)
MSERRAALFDLDRTLVSTDTAHLYTQFSRARGEANLADSLKVLWWMFEYTLGVIDAQSVAAQVLQRFRGKEEAWLIAKCEQLFPEYVLPELLPAGKAAVHRHREGGEVVAIVTGATRYIAGPVARELGIDHVVCTELEVDTEGRFTGRVLQPICYGPGKLERARRWLEAEGVTLDHCTFFSDSITDLPLLSSVGTPVVVNPDWRLRKVARQRGWRLELW